MDYFNDLILFIVDKFHGASDFLAGENSSSHFWEDIAEIQGLWTDGRQDRSSIKKATCTENEDTKREHVPIRPWEMHSWVVRLPTKKAIKYLLD